MADPAFASSSGPAGSVRADGELTGLPVYLLGSVDPESGDGPYGGPVMVDLDPSSGQTTQIYVGGLQICAGDKPALLARADTRCHSHFPGLRYDRNSTHPPYLTPGSVFANGTFQVAFPKDAGEPRNIYLDEIGGKTGGPTLHRKARRESRPPIRERIEERSRKVLVLILPNRHNDQQARMSASY